MFELILNGYKCFFLMLASVFGIGLSIIVLSFITSLLMLPLLKAVGGIVRRENEYQSVLLPQIAEIKRNYSTDMERTLHIQRLYMRYGYSPLSAVKKVLPLFVQIPFLLLTYYMLKSTPQLNGVSFVFLKDLGSPDTLISSPLRLPIVLNILPLIMTCVNLLTVASTPGFTRKDQISAISISLLFLVLLYNAPSAMLLYWTLNNIISFIRTLLSNHSAGLKLLLKRIALIREIPQFIRRSATPKAFAYICFSLMLIALYMLLLVTMLERCFNFLVSYWMMCVVLAILVWTSYYTLTKKQNGKRIVWKILLILSSLLGVGLIFIIGSVFFTLDLIYNTRSINMQAIFIFLFIAWSSIFIWEYRTGLPIAINNIKSAFRENGFLLLLPIIIAVHYSYASLNFTLPPASVFILALYLVLPVVILSAFSILVFGHHISMNVLFKIIIGVCTGAYLLPMFSNSSNLFLGYQTNMLFRFVLLFLLAYLFTRFKKRKTEILFISLLSIMLVINSNSRPNFLTTTARNAGTTIL